VPMLAQAQTNVTLYGRVDQSIGFEKNAIGSALLLNSGVQSSNRWGVRGAEDLGGGLKAIFNLEGGFNADVGQGLAAGGLDFRRRSVAGLEGGFGTLVMGRDYDPLFRVLLGADNLGLGHYNNVHTIFGATGGGGTSNALGYGVRIDNGVHYVSPSLGGFVLRGAYGFSEQFAAPKSNGRSIGVAGEFSTGPLYVGLGYRQNSLAVGNNKFYAAGARYNFGAFAINGGIGAVDVYTATGKIGDNANAWLGGDVQVGPGRLHLQAGTSKTRQLVTDAKFNSFGVTYNYPLSKRTNAYVTAGVLQNNANSNASLTTSSTAVAAGAINGDPKGVSFGIGHNF
jgi:predicted porin